MSWPGMHITTGLAISEAEHIKQSVRDILTTPVGTRLMRREYGSEIFELLDQPQNGATRLRLMAATVMALLRWEPRIEVSSVSLGSSAIDGNLTISLAYRRRDLNQAATLTISTGSPA